MAPLDTTVALSTLFERQARATPELIALEDDTRTLTYRELESATARLARRLRRSGVGRDSLVGVLMGRCADHVIGCLAALRAGGAFLALELAYPPAQLADVIADARPVVILTHGMHMARLGATAGGPSVVAIVMDREEEEDDDDHNQDQRDLPPLPPDDDLDRLCFVSYSSGTTGRPKGIANPHSAPVRSYGLRFRLSDLGPGDRIGCNVFFIWEMLRPLVRGATVVCVPDAAAYDPAALVDLLAARRVTETLMTPTLLAAVLPCHQDLAARLPALRTLWMNGEVVTTELGRRARAALPHTRLLNCYSASETHEIACGDVGPHLDKEGICPVGEPMDPTSIRILDEAGAQVPEGEAGELYVGGGLLARGYLNLPEVTARAFVADPFSAEPGARMYRTGDAARILPGGLIAITGRVGAMIKLRGYTVQPGAVEAAVVQHLAMAGVSRCAVVARGDGLERQLVAYVVAPVGRLPINTWGRWPAARRALAPHLAHYMIPAVWVAVRTLPTHGVSGKIDLAALPEPPSAGSSSSLSASLLPSLPHSRECDPDMGSIAGLWAKSLNLPVGAITAVDDDDDANDNDDSYERTFFDLGGHSLSLADLAGRLSRRFGCQVSVGQLAQRPTLAGHALVVAAARDGAAADNLALSSVAAHHLLPTIRADATLADDVRPAAAAKFRPLAEARTVLLTGATGFLGGFLLGALLEATTARIVCLVRVADPAGLDARPRAMARLRSCLLEHGAWSELVPDRVDILAGDLARPQLGRDDDGRDDGLAAVGSPVDVIIHAAAAVNLILPYGAVRAANVEGTRAVVRLACRIGATLHHISTNAVLPPSAEPWSEGDAIPVDDVPGRLPDGYGQAKWVAEQLILEAGRRGLPVRVYRPGNIGGDSRTGAANARDLLGAVLAESINLGAAPTTTGSGDGWRVEMTPVDHVARAVIGLASLPDGGHPQPTVFHLGNSSPPSCEDVFDALASAGYGPIDRVSFSEWAERWAGRRGGADSAPAGVLRAAGMAAIEVALATSTVLADSITAPLLQSVGVERPPRLGPALLSTYARHFYAAGWIAHPPPLPRPPPPAGPLAGKVAVVTGASSGIGAAVARALSAEGARVVLAARRVHELERVRDAILARDGSAAVLIRATDVTSADQVEALMGEATAALGEIDVVVACAGVMYYTLMASANMEQWTRTVDVNCRGLMHTLGAAVPRILARGPSRPGHVVAISSDAGRRPFPGLGIYSASKFFVEAALQALRLETVGTGLRVTSIQPGNVDTGLVGMSTDRDAIERYAGLAEGGGGFPVRVLAAEEVAEAVVWALRQPGHVAVNEVLVEPREQPM